MPGWDGNGNVTVTYDFTDQRDLGTNILASQVDQNMTDIVDAIENAIAKDGQNAATANLPMGGFRHTGVGNASARNHYLATGQFQDQSVIWATAGGTADAITLAPSPAITSYTAGQRFGFVASGANTGAVTVNISSLGAKNVTKRGATALAAGDIASAQVVYITYDGTQFQIADDVNSRPINMADNVLTRPEIKDYSETAPTVTISAGAATFNLESGNVITLTHDADLTSLTISNPSPTGKACSFTLIRVKDNSGTTRTITWPASVKWPGNIDPTLTQSATAVDIMTFMTVDAGTTWYANLAGNNYS